ncbi:lymphotoxin-alpha-like [Neopsephotus bourkii]|uniref:lymphotoxin-alpha-like n=1 Tax=Neopsephotus bourkii TaxID=309878 RepID=UPI002AA58E2E|nr:lymphotoxin-alpha-like [Neopsephotus bourkii]
MAPPPGPGPAPAPRLGPILAPILILGLGLSRAREPGAERESPELPIPPLMAGPKLLRDPYGDKPAAHVVASSSSPSLQWAADVAPAQMRNGIRLHGNRLVVPRDGLYFVYAAAAFHGGGGDNDSDGGEGPGCPSPSPSSSSHPPLLRLAVSRYSQEYPKDVPLLTAVRSVGRGCPDGLWFESLYQGAVFQLRRGDQLAATTTAGRFLDLHGGGRAYFGVVGVD